MLSPRSPLRLVLALLVALVPAVAALADAHEDMNVARSRMNASADRARRAPGRLSEEQKVQRRALLAEAQELHDETTSVGASDDAAAARLVQDMGAVQGELDDLLAAIGAPPASAEEPEVATMESSGPAAMPEEPPKPPGANVVVARYRDMVRDVVDIRARLLPDEHGQARQLILTGDALAAAIEANPHEDHVTRAADAAALTGVTGQLRGLHEAGLLNRRVGIPLLEARLTPTGWTNVGAVQGPFEILRARFLKPGSAYVTLRNASGEARPFAINVDFTDVAGQLTGNASFASQPDANLRAGEVREVLLAIAPSMGRFWNLTTDFTPTVR